MKSCIQKSLISLCLFILPFFCVGQNDNNKLTTIDSIKKVITESTVDSTIINSLVKWADLIRVAHPDSALVLHERVISICDQIIGNKEFIAAELNYYKRSKANSKNTIANVLFERSEYSDALDQYKEALSIYTEINDMSGQIKVESGIARYYVSTGSYPDALSLYEKANKYYEDLDDKKGLASTWHGLGLVYDYQGKYDKAINYYLKALVAHEETDNKRGAAVSINNIAILYFEQQDFDKALEYHTKALKIRRELGNQNDIGQSLNNIGLIYEFKQDFDKALKYYKQALEINLASNNSLGTSYSYTNLGIVQYLNKDYPSAISNHKKSLKIRQSIGDRSGVASSYNDLAIVSKDSGKCTQSIEYANSALKIADQIGNLELTEGVLKTLYECHKQLGNSSIALSYYEKHITAKDSLENKANQREVLKQELTYTYEKQTLADSLKFVQQQQLVQSELKVKKQQSYFLLGGLALALLFLGFIFKQKKLVETEKNKSEKLLLNILPEETAQELKEKGLVEAKSYNDTSILFTDFIGFSAIAEQLNPKELLHELNYCFSAFDTIMKNHGIEKIKTIGDSYMAASGVPNENNNHAEDAIQAAFEINRFMQDYMKNRKASNLPYFECRIGVNSGPLIAGVVGTQKFQYDVWGDTVNVASRMESKGESGKINISDSTYQLVKDNPKYHFVSRGVIRVKGGRDLDMYFISEQT